MTASVTSALGAGTWTIDPVHSSIGFSVRHLMVSKVRGSFESFSGTIVVGEDGSPLGVRRDRRRLGRHRQRAA